MSTAPLRVGAIVQARMGSSRLPGKVLLDIDGQSMLERVVTRVRAATTVQQVVVATTTSASDNQIAEWCERHRVEAFRGSEQDVLDRYYQAAMHLGLDVVVRVTSDCPLLDPAILDSVVMPLLAPGSTVEFSANTLERSFPRGLDVEAVTLGALQRVWQTARSSDHREHVFPYIYEHREQFVIRSLRAELDQSHMRWTVDTPEDLAVVRELSAAVGPTDHAWTSVLNVISRRPELMKINEDIRQKSAH